MNIKSYLMDPVINGIDEEGNSSMHQLTKFEQLQDLEDQISSSPHLLFLLNKSGLIPLDLAITTKEDEKARLMIDRMNKLSPNCSLKFIQRPQRLDLRFEKSFTLAVLRNNREIIEAFPQKSIKTAYVSMGQIKDYKQYKDEKSQYHETITTPFHLACRLSNDDAVRHLVEDHQFDINVLLNEKSAIYELLSTSGYLDFNILNYLLKKRKP